jgi:integrase
VPVEYISHTNEPIAEGLSVVQKLWKTPKGTIKKTYRVRIYQPSTKTYHHKTLKCDDFLTAKKLAIEYYAKVKSDVESGKTIQQRIQPLTHYIDLFIESRTMEAKNNQVSERRVEVMREQLRTLERFWEHCGKPRLNALAERYEEDFKDWRSQQTNRNTGKPLSLSYQNGEIGSHRQFYRWLKLKRLADRTLEVTVWRNVTGNDPFPREHYQKLLSVARKEIDASRISRDHWNRLMFYYVILTMSNVGCRVTEIRNMKWSDLTKVGDDYQLFIHGKGKQRNIIISNRVAEYLLQWKTYKSTNGQVGEYMFTPWKKETPFVRISQAIKDRWFGAAGLQDPTDWEFVCFRHLFITNALNGGTDSLFVSKYCGTSQAMIEKTYSNMVKKEVFELVFKSRPSESLEMKGILPKHLRLDSSVELLDEKTLKIET